MSETPADQAKAEAARQLVILVFGMLTLAAYMAMMKPDFARTLRMRVSRAVSRLAAEYASRAAHFSMGSELRTGVREYTVPYLLSIVRDRAQEMYGKESGALCHCGEPPSRATRS